MIYSSSEGFEREVQRPRRRGKIINNQHFSNKLTEMWACFCQNITLFAPQNLHIPKIFCIFAPKIRVIPYQEPMQNMAILDHAYYTMLVTCTKTGTYIIWQGT